MFTPSFVRSLGELAKSTPEVVVAKLHRAFGKIDKLGEHDIAIAYQTIDTTMKSCGFADCPVLQGLRAAALARMQFLTKEAQQNKRRPAHEASLLRQWYSAVSGLSVSAF